MLASDEVTAVLRWLLFGLFLWSSCVGLIRIRRRAPSGLTRALTPRSGVALEIVVAAANFTTAALIATTPTAGVVAATLVLACYNSAILVYFTRAPWSLVDCGCFWPHSLPNGGSNPVALLLRNSAIFVCVLAYAAAYSSAFVVGLLASVFGVGQFAIALGWMSHTAASSAALKDETHAPEATYPLSLMTVFEEDGTATPLPIGKEEPAYVASISLGCHVCSDLLPSLVALQSRGFDVLVTVLHNSGEEWPANQPHPPFSGYRYAPMHRNPDLSFCQQLGTPTLLRVHQGSAMAATGLSEITQMTIKALT